MLGRFYLPVSAQARYNCGRPTAGGLQAGSAEVIYHQGPTVQFLNLWSIMRWGGENKLSVQSSCTQDV